MVQYMEVVNTALLCCFLTLVSLWCWIRWRNRHIIRAASKLPLLLPTLPILGNIHHYFLGIERMTSYGIDNYIKLLSEGNSSFCVWLGPYPLIVLGGVEDLQKINNSMKAPERGYQMDRMKFILGNGLLTAPANIWKTTRRAMDPLFQSRHLKQLMPTFNKNIRELVDRMSQYEGRGSVDVSTVIIGTSIQSICPIIFGHEVEFEVESEEFRSLVNLLTTAPEIIVHKMFKFWLHFDLIYKYLYKKEIEKMNLQWEHFSKAPLKIAKHNIENKHLEKEDFIETDCEYIPENKIEGPINLISVYSVLQQKFPGFTEEDLKAEIMTMYIAGADSISYSVSAGLLLLAYHQDIQEQLYKEISSVMDPDNNVTYESLQKMPYLDKVFKETLRWSLVVPLNSRRAHEDIKLSCCTIPRGTSFILAHVAPFLDSKIYSDPRRFNPEHFSPDNSKTRDRAAYLPFNAGPRSCIGKLYAEILFKTILVHVLRKFKLSTEMDVYKLKRKISLFLHCSEGYNIRLQHRAL